MSDSKDDDVEIILEEAFGDSRKAPELVRLLVEAIVTGGVGFAENVSHLLRMTHQESVSVRIGDRCPCCGIVFEGNGQINGSRAIVELAKSMREEMV